MTDGAGRVNAVDPELERKGLFRVLRCSIMATRCDKHVPAISICQRGRLCGGNFVRRSLTYGGGVSGKRYMNGTVMEQQMEQVRVVVECS